MKIFLPIFLLFFISVLFFFRISTSYRMPVSYNYDSDFGRDLLFIQRITHGKQILIGPQLSFAGLHLGPYPFYLFAPFLKITNGYKSVLIANALFFILGFALLLFYLSKRLGIKYSLLSLLWLSTTPYMILAARSPGNAFSYLIFLLVYLAILIYWEEISPSKILFMGFFAGLIINFHPISVIAVVIPFLVKIMFRKGISIKNKFSSFLIYFLSLALTFIPVLIFEVRHKFIIIQTAFDTSRYGEFFGNSSSLGINFINPLWSFNQASSEWIPLGIFVLLSILIVVLRYSKRINETRLWFWATLISVLSLFIFGKWAPHYFFPIIALSQMAAIIIIRKSRLSLALMAFLILINIYFFPRISYTNARNLGDVENKFTQMLKKANLPKQDINVVLINDTHLSAVGYEYRYLLEKYGYNISDEFSYKDSRFLLLVSEKGEIDWGKETSWELSQFGSKKLRNLYKADDAVFYLFEKTIMSD